MRFEVFFDLSNFWIHIMAILLYIFCFVDLPQSNLQFFVTIFIIADDFVQVLTSIYRFMAIT